MTERNRNRILALLLLILFGMAGEMAYRDEVDRARNAAGQVALP